MYRIFKAAIEGWKPPAADLALLNAELARAREHEQLVFGGGMFAVDWESGPAALDAMLWPAVRSAATLLTAGELARVTQCAGPDCAWLFLDSTRNRSRRWCDMADCGNLAKVRRFRGRN
jgi:predicted RNA-binding Zn ribbon-like protein